MKNRLKRALLTVVSLSLALFSMAQQGDDLPQLDYNNPKSYVIEDIKVTGVKYLNPELIINSTGLQKGDTIILPSEHIATILNQLWQYRYYSDVKAFVDIEGDKAFLEFELTERPRVSAWNINGVKKSEEKEIRERLNLKERVELSEFTLKNSKNIISRFLEEKGYRKANVRVTQVNDPNLDNFVQVTFEIEKSDKVKIKAINFIGNENLPENKLKKAMKETREKTLINLFKSAKLNKASYSTDKQLVEDYMASSGYRDGKIVSDSIYYVSDNRIAIDITVEEGDKYFYRDISWVGNEKHPDKLLNQLLSIEKGDVYNKKKMEKRLGVGAGGSEAMMSGEINVSTLYQNNGHLAFEVQPVETVIEGDSIDIQMKIHEGKQFVINNVDILGNSRTNDHVIRRDLYVRPGELYNQAMIIQSIRQLGSMGHFNAETIQPDIQPISDELVNVGFKLEETPSDQFEVSGGWGDGMFVASVAVTFNNISMRKLFDKEAWRPYPAGDNQKLNISAQSNGSYYNAFSLSFVEPWLGGKKPNSLYTSIYYSSQSDAYYTWQKSTAHFNTLGVSAALTQRLSWPDPNFTFTTELAYKRYKLDNWSSFVVTDGVSNTISAAITLGRNSVDQMIYPRTGSEMFIKGAATPPWSLFNNIDYSNKDLSGQDRYRWIEYYKFTAMARFFMTLSPNQKLVLMARAEGGYLGNYNKHLESPFEGFLVGGDGVTGYSLYGVDNIGLRGYENGALTPYVDYGEQGQAYVKYTAELRYPIILSPQTNMYGLIFAEGGNAFFNWQEFNMFNIKRSVGVGLRVYMPIVGMFGVDWGYGLDSVPGKDGKRSGSQFHFSIGQTF